MSAHWLYKGFSLLLIVFCFELGVFLLVYPWTFYWQTNAIPSAIPRLLIIWNSDYLRGGVSGFGIVNLWIAILEVARFGRLNRPADPAAPLIGQ